MRIGRAAKSAVSPGTWGRCHPGFPAAFGGTLRLALALLIGCASVGPPGAGLNVVVAPSPSDAEAYCAWFGDRRGDTLYFGESAFWSSLRRAEDPTADLERPGPARVGRFDLRRERWLPFLDVSEPGSRSGVWDVLAHPNGRVYFTTYFEPAGWVDPASGTLRRLPALGAGLNEIALAPDGSLAISRYPTPDGTPGSLVRIDPEGALEADHPIPVPEGYVPGPKTVAVDPDDGRVWLAMDLLPTDPDAGLPVRHDAVVLEPDGRVALVFAEPELQFPAFAADGTGYFVESEGRVLSLRVVPAAEDPTDLGAGRRIVLDADFPPALDFAQEARPLPDGGAIVTRWSGRVHLVDRTGGVRNVRLPQLVDGGLYYTAVRRDGRICATYCGGVRVVCDDAP